MDVVSTANNFEGSSKKRPLSSFIRKLWFILSDIEFEEFIYWVDNGQVICIPNSISFSQAILPKFFKHNNWQSFVRQLNLYGFRKVYQLNLTHDDIEKRTVWHFKHDFFQKDKPENLYQIKRGASTTNKEVSEQENCEIIETNKKLEKELKQVKLKLEQVDEKREYLSKQIIYLNQLQANQQEAINVLSHTILHIVNNNPNIRVKEKKFSEIVNDLLNKNFINQRLSKDLILNENIDHVVEDDDEEEYDELEPDDEVPMKNMKYPVNPAPSNKSLPSISSLINDTSSEILPPIKRQKY